MSNKTMSHWIVRFCIGAVVVAFCSFVTWADYLLLTMMMDPNLKGEAYRVAVRERMGANLLLTVLLIASCAGVLFGVVQMGRAVFSRVKAV